MTPLEWLLSYLLFGFAMFWVGAHILGHVERKNMWWDLAAILLWPVAVICGLARKR